MVDSRPVLFFDIDNCLYPKSKKVQHMMSDLIDEFFMNHLSLTRADANQLHLKYFKDYGLAIEGLVRHHKVDPIEYNSKVDDALPLEQVIFRDDRLRSLLSEIDKAKVKMWLFTNAYITHGMRVVKLLGIHDLFEGITYCDYGAATIICKPHLEMFKKAMDEAGVDSVQDCFFVDDSALNCAAARALGWTTAHLLEPDEPAPATKAADFQISQISDLRDVFPWVFKPRQMEN